ncbi:GNAT family N-acetyltransferase [Shewanella sp. D64]|uniref:GNAT family N-acetyltransferase n=1 Tax=unclassified Shewanella TaxID=196818 RepID=UPI0022BA462D|nr:MULTISPECIES: GNAT family N-acetyltransferase [unclassified Shewanella]MEC4727926.1 GNAT family N-acetyltransferase [Shewanella sp. D64]MEC4740102.1 GNAT family N-acetyltransferase [Shewanella sp. E94]WBJ95871.1 GNAT family N-acetyltransferase [Shewanella sp. MTB7]
MKLITETERLIIREFNLGDAQAVLHFNTPEEVNRFTGDAGMCASLSDAENIITEIWLKEYQQHGFARWVIVLKETGTTIGFCGFKQETRIEAVDIGYRLHPDYWGRGYATEANLACIEYANKNMDLDHILGDVVHENTASANVLQKLGMRFQSQYQDMGFDVDRYEIFLND